MNFLRTLSIRDVGAALQRRRVRPGAADLAQPLRQCHWHRALQLRHGARRAQTKRAVRACGVNGTALDRTGRVADLHGLGRGSRSHGGHRARHCRSLALYAAFATFGRWIALWPLRRRCVSPRSCSSTSCGGSRVRLGHRGLHRAAGHLLGSQSRDQGQAHGQSDPDPRHRHRLRPRHSRRVADGAMAAIVSGVFSALYVRFQQRWYGYIKRGVWHPGSFRLVDPRLTQGVQA